MRKIIFLIYTLFCLLNLKAQEQWNLSSCIEYAYQNNISLQQNKISVDLAHINLKESKYKMLPDLGASLNGGISFGRNVDPTSNAFTTQDILYSNYSLSSSLVLFQGGFIRNSIKQHKINLEAADKEYQQSKNEIALSIATYYLNILLSQERLDISAKNRETAKTQLDQINKLIAAGARPEADALELKSQLARADQSYIIAENALQLGWLTLKQALRLDPETKMILEPLSESQLNDITIHSYTFSELLDLSLNNQPGVQAAKSRLEAAKLGIKLARAMYYPSVFLSASIGSRFSDAAIRPKEYSLTKETIPGITIDNIPVKFEQEYLRIKPTEVIPFNTQFDQFLGYGAGVSINIPIYNKHMTKSSVDRSKLNSKQSELQLELYKEKLSQDIYQAMANVKSAIKEYEASKDALQAAKSSYEITQKRFDIGMANVFELNQIQTNFLNAETSFLIAKYDLVFKQKVLDYYAGKKIKL
jgi:outer membrane protein